MKCIFYFLINLLNVFHFVRILVLRISLYIVYLVLIQCIVLLVFIGLLVGCQTSQDEGAQTVFAELQDAEQLGQRIHKDPNTEGWVETVYRTTDGRYLMHVKSGPESRFYGDTFTEWLPEDRAEAWLNQYR